MILDEVRKAIVESQVENIVDLSSRALQEGLEPLEIINEGLVPGMKEVGDKYECGEYFLPHLIIAADGMKKALDFLEPHLKKSGQERIKEGTIVIGTVQGDIHEIGKTLVATLLSANGFEVHDLGVDVPPLEFVEKAQEVGADIIALSALLTTTMTVQKDVIEALQDIGIRDEISVIVGGAPVSRSWADQIGADGFADDALSAVSLSRNLCQSKAW